ncbi:hypothetical protein TI05_06325 [Achromatium sp. WMS3]|nr:hypothetical protein TI05_06325 [Achromatium sp. WMS3]
MERSETYQIHLIIYCTQSFLLLLWIGAKVANMIFEYGFRLALPILRTHHQQQTSLPTLMEVHAVLNTTPCHIGWYHWQTAPNKP